MADALPHGQTETLVTRWSKATVFGQVHVDIALQAEARDSASTTSSPRVFGEPVAISTAPAKCARSPRYDSTTDRPRL